MEYPMLRITTDFLEGVMYNGSRLIEAEFKGLVQLWLTSNSTLKTEKRGGL